MCLKCGLPSDTVDVSLRRSRIRSLTFLFCRMSGLFQIGVSAWDRLRPSHLERFSLGRNRCADVCMLEAVVSFDSGADER